MPGRLTIHLENLPVRRLYVEEDSEYVVGRSADCDLQINHPQLSRRHAQLSWLDGHWHIEDLGSKNGLVLNGRKISQGEISDDAWVQFGDVVARFENVTPEARERENNMEQRRWETSLELRRQLDPAAGLEKLLHQVLRSVLSLSGTERGFAMLTTPNGDLSIKSYSGVSPEDFEDNAFSGSVGAIEMALTSSEMIMTCDAMTDSSLGERPSVTMGGIKALICLPLIVLDKTIGILYADSKEPGKTFTELDIEILQGLSDHAAMAIAVARIRDEIAGLGQALPEMKSSDQTPDEDLLKDWADQVPGFAHGLPLSADNGSDYGVTWSDLKSAHASKSGPDQ